jgi:hypothetical protein
MTLRHTIGITMVKAGGGSWVERQGASKVCDEQIGQGLSDALFGRAQGLGDGARLRRRQASVYRDSPTVALACAGIIQTAETLPVPAGERSLRRRIRGAVRRARGDDRVRSLRASSPC